MKPHVSLVLFSFNNAATIEKSINTILECPGPSREILLVDNNSFDWEMRALLGASAQMEAVRVLSYGYSFRFAKAANWAASHARGDFIVFFRPGLDFSPEWLRNFFSSCLDQAFDLGGCSVHFDGVDAAISTARSPSHGRPIMPEEGFIPVNCLWIRKEVWREMGGFDPDFWYSLSEADLSRRIRQSSGRVMLDKEPVVIHGGEKGFPPPRPMTLAYDSFLYKNKKDPARICIVLPMTLGDIVLGTAVAHGLRLRYPNAYIAYATASPYADILRNNPYIDEIIALPDCKPQDQLDALEYVDRVTKEVIEKGCWDRVYQLQIQDLPTGYWGTPYHLKELYCDLANLEPGQGEPSIFPGEAEKEKVDNLFKESLSGFEKLFVVHTGAGWDLKVWPLFRYEQLLNILGEKARCKAFIVGAPGDGVPKGSAVVDLVGKLSLLEIAELLRRADIFIGSDSGPMHMAAAMGTPSVILFGCTSPPTGGPLGPNYICIQSDRCCGHPCHVRICYTGERCIEWIPVRHVAKAVVKLLKRKGQVRKTWWRAKTYPDNGRGIFNGPGGGGFAQGVYTDWTRWKRFRQRLYYALNGAGRLGRLIRIAIPSRALEKIRMNLGLQAKPISRDNAPLAHFERLQ